MDEPSPKLKNSDRKADSLACAKPNFAGLVSRGQQAEMRVLLAGKWPALKPLPVFKYETAEYRAAIDFDKLRGEWVCRKISFPSNKIQELRGGLTELTLALPRGVGEVLGREDGAAGEAGEELAKDAARRALAMEEWRNKSESGTLYSELEKYLSRSQQEEIYEVIRLTLTARQLQFLAKNVAYVFDALSKAGGRLAILVEIGQRKKAGPGMDVEEPAREFEAEPVKSVAAAVGGGLAAAAVESVIPAATFEKLPTEAIGSALPEPEQTCSAERILHAASASLTPEMVMREMASPEILGAGPELPSLAEQLRERGDALKRAPALDHGRIPLFGLGPRVRAGGVELPGEGFQRPASRGFVLEISGLQVAAFSLVVLFAAVSLTVGLSVGGESFGKRLRDVEKSIMARDAASPAVPNGPGDVAARNSSGADKVEKAKDATAGDSEEKSKVGDAGPETLAKAPAMDSKPPVDSNSSSTIEPKAPAPVSPVTSHEGNDSSGVTARHATQRPSAKPAHLLKAARPMNGAVKSPAERRVASAGGAAPHVSTAGTILVRGAGDGSKPFRLTLPEKAIGASRTFAMSAQLSVLVAPEPGLAAAHQPARLKAGEIVSFVWPRYSGPADRHGAAETIKVRTTIGTSGQVEDIKLVSGPASLFSAATSAIRQWRFKPTLLDERPVQAQEDVTIAFRR